MTLLFASKKETEEVITRRVSRRVERYVEKLKTYEHSLRASQNEAENHSNPELPAEFDDDVPTLILSARNQTKTPAKVSLDLESKSESGVANFVYEKAIAADVEHFQPQVTSADVDAGAAFGTRPSSKKSPLKILEAAHRSEHGLKDGFEITDFGNLQRFQKDPDVGISEFTEDSLDLGRFAEVSRYAVPEKKSKSRAGKELNPKQVDSQPNLSGAEVPRLYVSSRFSLAFFSIVVIGILVVLYFLLVFDKYVY